MLPFLSCVIGSSFVSPWAQTKVHFFLLPNSAVWCDVGDHLTAGHGDTAAAHPVVLALPAVVVPDGTAIRERHAHLPAGGVRDRVPVPAAAGGLHLLRAAGPLAVRLVVDLGLATVCWTGS